MRGFSISLLTVLFWFYFASGKHIKISEKVTLKGKEINARDNKITSFTGVKYAEREPFYLPELVTYDKKEMVIDCTTTGYVCPRVHEFGLPSGLEALLGGVIDQNGAVINAKECLTLDLFMPSAAKEGDNYDVVLYVHGGSLKSGSRAEGYNNGEQFLRDESFGNSTILVSVEYSLGPFGFFMFTDDRGTVHGNLALHDVIKSIQWVHKYIKKFGGDANNITIMGHSAGAALVQYVHIMLRNKELRTLLGFENPDAMPFKKMALFSGSSFLFHPLGPEEARGRQEKVMMASRCAPKDGFINDDIYNKAIYCFVRLSEKEVIEASRRTDTFWSPVIDNKFLIGDIEFHLGSLKTDLDFDFRPLVLITVTKDDGSVFCLSHSKAIKSLGLEYWRPLLKKIERAIGNKGVEGAEKVERVNDTEIVNDTKRVNDMERKDKGEWEQKEQEMLIDALKGHYHCSKFKGCNVRAGVCLATDAIFIGPARKSERYYISAGMKVIVHQHAFIFEKLEALIVFLLALGTIGDVIRQIGYGGGRSRITKFTEKMMVLGTFHSADIWMLFNTRLTKRLRVDMISSRAQMDTITRPIYSFVKTGMVQEADLVDPREIPFEIMSIKVGHLVESFMGAKKNKQDQRGGVGSTLVTDADYPMLEAGKVDDYVIENVDSIIEILEQMNKESNEKEQKAGDFIEMFYKKVMNENDKDEKDNESKDN